MTGVLNAVAGTAVGQPIIVTMGTGGSDFFGFSTGSYGSVSPSDVFGKAVRSINCGPAFADLRIEITDTSIAASFFRSVSVQRTDGVVQTYYTASATSSSVTGSGREWRWGNGNTAANRVFTALTPSPRTVTFFR